MNRIQQARKADKRTRYSGPKVFIGIDGLLALAAAHPEFRGMHHIPAGDRHRAIVTRNGESIVGECTDQEAATMAETSKVWKDHPVKMASVTAIRRAIEKAFPEFVPK